MKQLEQAEREYAVARAQLEVAQRAATLAFRRVVAARAAEKERVREENKASGRAAVTRAAYAERDAEIWRRRKAGETFTAIAKSFGIAPVSARIAYLKAEHRINPPPPPPPAPPEPPGKCQYCTGPTASRFAERCHLCRTHGVLGRVLFGRTPPFDFHAHRREAALGVATD